MKVCIVCIAKNESKYINEWLNYHLNLGFDNIIVCNNDNVYSDINIDKVINIDCSKIRISQYIIYTSTFKKYKDQYDWILFIDCDEFVTLDSKYKNIKEFLSDTLFKEADIIRLHWKIFSGGNDLDVIDDNYNIINRFTEHFPMEEEKYAKSFIKTSVCNKEKYTIYGHGYFDDKTLNVVNAIGEPCLNEWSTAGEIPIHQNAWINHYPTKTICEYIRQKYFRGGPNFNDVKYHSFKYFFKYNRYDKKIEEYGIKYAKKYFNEIKDKQQNKNIYIAYKFKQKDK